MTKKKQKIFSLKEINALLPNIEKSLKNLQGKKEAYSRIHDALFMHELVCAAELSKGLPSGEDNLEAGIHALEDAIEALASDVEEFFASGNILRSIDKGRVEFLGTYDGETVYFSWELGEPSIQYYRPLSSSVDERRLFPPATSKRKTK